MTNASNYEAQALPSQSSDDTRVSLHVYTYMYEDKRGIVGIALMLPTPRNLEQTEHEETEWKPIRGIPYAEGSKK